MLICQILSAQEVEQQEAEHNLLIRELSQLTQTLKESSLQINKTVLHQNKVSTNSTRWTRGWDSPSRRRVDMLSLTLSIISSIIAVFAELGLN